MKSRYIIMAIKPRYVRMILNNQKKYEFRRKIFKNEWVKYIFVYATSPINKIVCILKIQNVIKDSPESLWNKYHSKSGIDKKSFFEYFDGCETGYALEIEVIKKFDPPLDPYNLFYDFTPPQSFRYLHLSDLQRTTTQPLSIIQEFFYDQQFLPI